MNVLGLKTKTKTRVSGGQKTLHIIRLQQGTAEDMLWAEATEYNDGKVTVQLIGAVMFFDDRHIMLDILSEMLTGWRIMIVDPKHHE